jgi:hypothetical protein
MSRILNILKKIITNNWFLYFFLIFVFSFISMCLSHIITNQIHLTLHSKSNTKTLYYIIYFCLYMISYILFNIKYMYINYEKEYDKLHVGLDSKNNLIKYNLILKLSYPVYNNGNYNYNNFEIKFKNIIDFYFTFKKKLKNITEEDYLLYMLNKNIIKIENIDNNYEKTKLMKKLRQKKIKKYVA